MLIGQNNLFGYYLRLQNPHTDPSESIGGKPFRIFFLPS
jgi:hypothetical protein